MPSLVVEAVAVMFVIRYMNGSTVKLHTPPLVNRGIRRRIDLIDPPVIGLVELEPSGRVIGVGVLVPGSPARPEDSFGWRWSHRRGPSRNRRRASRQKARASSQGLPPSAHPLHHRPDWGPGRGRHAARTFRRTVALGREVRIRRHDDLIDDQTILTHPEIQGMRTGGGDVKRSPPAGAIVGPRVDDVPAAHPFGGQGLLAVQAHVAGIVVARGADRPAPTHSASRS